MNATLHRMIMSGLAEMISTQFHNVIVVPTIEHRRIKNKVVHTTQDINVSIKSTLFENIPAPILHTLAGAIDRYHLLFDQWCNRFIIQSLTHRNQKSFCRQSRPLRVLLRALIRKNTLELGSPLT